MLSFKLPGLYLYTIRACLHAPSPCPSLSKLNIVPMETGPFDGKNGFRTRSVHQTVCHHSRNVNLTVTDKHGDGDGTCKQAFNVARVINCRGEDLISEA